MAKIERKYLAHFINVGSVDAPEYERLGKDLEEFSPELHAQVETKKNILGQTDVLISGYEKSGAVAPYYYAEKDSPLFDKLQRIIDEQLMLDSLRADVVEVKLWKEAEGGFEAYKEQAFIEVTSYGGDTTGYQIPFTLHFTGERVKGIFDPNTRSFTAQ